MQDHHAIPENIISCIKTHITNTHIKTKDIGFLGKKFGLSFIPCEPQDRPSQPCRFKVQEIGKKNNNYTALDQDYPKPIPLLIFKNHWMLCEEGIKYNGKKYNTYRLLGALIKDGILKPMTMNEKLLIKSNYEVYLRKLTDK